MIDWNSCDVSSVMQGKSIAYHTIPDSTYTRGFGLSCQGGEEGVILLLKKIMSIVPSVLFSIRCQVPNNGGAGPRGPRGPHGSSSSSSAAAETVCVASASSTASATDMSKFTTVLEVSPCKIKENSWTTTRRSRNTFNHRMIYYGDRMVSRALNPADCNRKVYEVLAGCFSRTVPGPEDYFQVPSDTGLVVLRLDLTLAAIRDIPAGTEVTCIPYTPAGNVICVDCPINHLLSCGQRSGLFVPLKKLIPFAGFGAFAKVVEDGENANTSVSYRDGVFFLVATKNIQYSEQIVRVCSSPSLSDSSSSGGNTTMTTTAPKLLTTIQEVSALVNQLVGTVPQNTTRSAAFAKSTPVDEDSLVSEIPDSS